MDSGIGPGRRKRQKHVSIQTHSRKYRTLATGGATVPRFITRDEIIRIDPQDATIRRLRDFCLVTESPDGTLTINPLVRAWLERKGSLTTPSEGIETRQR